MGWLTEDDLRRFAVDGYLVVQHVVPESLLGPADAEIDELIAEVEPHEGDRGPGQSAWFPSRSRLPRCEDVLRLSPALEIAEELVQPNTLDHAFDHIQVAITVPRWSHIPGGPHIDGHGPGQDPPASFTLLAGVLLTDQHDSHSGNLWVWPGSHLDHQRLFHQRGTKVLRQTGGHSTLLDPPTRLSSPVAITGGRGDLVLAHFLLGHNKGGNTASHDRRTIYYRLAASGHPDRWEQTFLDAWTEYPPVRRAL
jgi:ectoine hydroxylase-related dioxygenase (phytanoyl-CoA dioxygenase family)